MRGSNQVSVFCHIEFSSDRFKPGQLVLFEGDVPVFSAPCLGRSAGGDADNPDRDPARPYGDTPAGRYASTFVSRLPGAIAGIGDLFIPLDAVAGPALDAERAGRRGLGIHGGRGDDRLYATRGSIRLLDKDMAELARIAGKRRFDVVVDG